MSSPSPPSVNWAPAWWSKRWPAACHASSSTTAAPAGLITAASGIKVSLGNKDHLIAEFAREMAGLAADSVRRRRYGNQAHRDAMETYTWSVKGAKTAEVYKWVLGQRGQADVLSEAGDRADHRQRRCVGSSRRSPLPLMLASPKLW